MYNGKKCASTTRYHDGRKVACGCGLSTSDFQFPWVKSAFIASANQALFDSNGKTWCGQACGKCVKLTTTGGFIPYPRPGHGRGSVMMFMIGNLCPIPAVGTNPDWCNQQASNSFLNQYGYEWHFSLENGDNQMLGAPLGWDNPEVTWEWANCDLYNDGRNPTNFMYRQCQCGNVGKSKAG